MPNGTSAGAPRQFIHRICTALLAAALVAASLPARAPAQSAQPPGQAQEIPGPVGAVKLPPNTFVIALMGIDKRPTRNFKNTDVLMFAAVNPDIPSVTVLSVPRDTQVYVPGNGVTKVNQAYAMGGWPLFKQTILYNFGLKIDNYAMVNFEGLVRAVDILGGVDVIATCPISHIFPRDPYYMGPAVLTQNYKDTFTGEIWKAGTKVPTTILDIPKPGVYSLDGLHALAFVRARKGIPGGDVDRVRREQRTARALFAKAKDTNALLKIPQLFTQLQPYFTTDLTLPRILQLAGLADKFSDLNIRSRYLDTGGNIGAALPGNPTGNFWSDRRDYIEEAFNVSLNQRPNEGIPVEVVNGTNDAGFAIAAADRLRELGFRVVDLLPADQAYKESEIIDYSTTSKGSAVPLLTRTFDVDPKNVTKQPRKDGPRYRIVVGSDFNTCYYSKSLQASGSEDIEAFDEPDEADVTAPSTVTDFIVPLTPTAVVVKTPVPAPKAVVTATAVAAAPAATPAPAGPEASPPPAVLAPAMTLQVPAGDLVNVRSGPSIQYPIITRLGENMTATVTARTAQGPWLQIALSDRFGWLNSDFVRISGDAATLPVASAPQLPGRSTARVIVPAGDFVNMRVAPNTKARVIGIMRSRQSAPVIGSNRDQTWWQVRFGDVTAWVNTGVVAEVGDFADVPVVAP